MTLVKFQPAHYRGLFDFLSPQFDPSATQPAVNIVQTPQGFRIEIAAPGLEKSDFNIRIEDGMLHVSAQKEAQAADNSEQVRRREFSFRSFRRSFRLPDTIDPAQIGATYQNGILLLNLSNKPEAQPLTKSIAVE
ncbi:MAG: Hsp20/alpha crystallin family protein [Saprospiraceae bacterium]|nr:Hsp20/alpha crystallin family protein [Saprospiraceae bacterium]